MNSNNLSIISDNCWSYFTHQLFNLEYSSPFIDTLVSPKIYCDLVTDILTNNINLSNIREISRDLFDCSNLYDRSNEKDLYVLIDDRYPLLSIHINKFNDYKSRWLRRIPRLNLDNLVVKLAYKDNCDKDIISRFINLDFDIKKIIYLPYNLYKDVIKLYQGHSVVINSGNLLIYVLNYYDESGYVEDDPIDDLILKNFLNLC